MKFKFLALRAEGEVALDKGKLDIEVWHDHNEWSVTMTVVEGSMVISVITTNEHLYTTMKVISRLEGLFDSKDWEQELKDIIKQWGNR